MGLIILADSVEQVYDTFCDDLSGEEFVAQPNEGDEESFVSREDMFVEAICFPNLSFDTIAVDSMLETPLGNRYQYLRSWFGAFHINYPYGKG